jgi:toxin ParE1/3/4
VTRWRLLPRARADIDGIWDYTAREYGIEQAVAYLRAIEAAVIAHERAQSCDHIRPGYWRIKADATATAYQPAVLHFRLTPPRR